MRKSFLIYILCHIAILTSCASNLKLSNIKHFDDSLTGTAFYEKSKAYDQKLLDSLFIDSFFKGQAPEFFFNFRPITVKHTDSLGIIILFVFIVPLTMYQLVTTLTGQEFQ